PQFLVSPHLRRVHGDEAQEDDEHQRRARSQGQRLPAAVRPPEVFDDAEKGFLFRHGPPPRGGRIGGTDSGHTSLPSPARRNQRKLVTNAIIPGGLRQDFPDVRRGKPLPSPSRADFQRRARSAHRANGSSGNTGSSRITASASLRSRRTSSS